MAAVAMQAPDSTAALPRALPSWQIEAARHDPFAPTIPAIPALPLAQAPPPVAPAPMHEAPPAPKAPPVTVRYLGSIVNPEGVRVVLLARGDTAIAAHVGMSLGDGYIVQAIEPTSVRLVYPPLANEVVVPIPFSVPTN